MQGRTQPEKVKYFGERTENGGVVVVEDEHGCNVLPIRNDLRNLDTWQYDWGIQSRATQALALAILADALKDDAAAARLYLWFGLKFLVRADRQRFVITLPQINTWAIKALLTDLNMRGANA